MSDKNRTDPRCDERVVTIIPDANVLIHGKTLAELPWSELGYQTVEILLVAPVIRELDKLKNQPGRPNKIARQLSSDIRELHGAADRSVVLRVESPKVIKRVDIRTINISKHEALKLDHADQALINYSLYIQESGKNVLLLTDDTICGATAQEFGLPTKFLPPHWLRDPEPDDATKENNRLKAEIKHLKETEPRVALSFRDVAGNQIERFAAQIMHWPKLSGGQIDTLMAAVEQHCPMATSFTGQDDDPSSITGEIGALWRKMANPWSSYEPPTEGEINLYRTRNYPNWLEAIRTSLASLHQELAARTQWPVIRAIADNTGTRPAEGVLLQIWALGRFSILESDSANDESEQGGESQGISELEPYQLNLPPEPPRGRVRSNNPLEEMQRLYKDMRLTGIMPHEIASLNSLDAIRGSLNTIPRRRSDVFYWREGRGKWGGRLELECTSWRHGQEDVCFNLKVRPNEQVDVSGAIELGVHAHNIADPLTARLPIEIRFTEGATLAEANELVRNLATSARLHERL
jgi:hypothetical protein